jgi:hypothetical protein
MVAQVARRRARHGGEDGAADHVGVQQAPGQPGDPRRQAAEHALAQLGAEQDFAHPHEQGRAVSVQLEAEPQMVTAIASPAGRDENSCMPIQATPVSVRPIQTPLPSSRNSAAISRR